MTPRDIVAVMLASFLFFLAGGKIVLLFAGKAESPETDEALLALVQFIAGGLLTYIGLREK